MVRYFAIPPLLLLFVPTEVRSGESAPPVVRREFKQSATYPYVFVPVGYLSNGGPLPLLFGPAASDCDNRNPPPVPKDPKNEKGKSSTAPRSSAPSPSSPANPALSGSIPAVLSPSLLPAPEAPATNPEPPAYPPPDAQALPQEESLDLNKYPAEVIGIFKNPYNVPKSHEHFFDPIFEPPAPPPPTQTSEAPPSKATYRQQ
jgi:hypothetical protein